jgi:hypothetical protein
MPGFLLTSGSTLMCLHGGQAQATMPSLRVRLGGQPAVLQTAPHVVAGCTLPPTGSPPPCIVANWTTGALRVRSMGNPVLLQDSVAICPSSGGTLMVVQTQVRVRGQ